MTDLSTGCPTWKGPGKSRPGFLLKKTPVLEQCFRSASSLASVPTQIFALPNSSLQEPTW